MARRPRSTEVADAAGRTTDGQGPPDDDVRRLAEVTETVIDRHLLARGFLVGTGLTVAMTLFVVQNTDDGAFSWLWFDFSAPLWLALLVAFAAGAVASPLLLAAWRRSRRHRRERTALTRRLRGSGRPTTGPAGRIAESPPSSRRAVRSPNGN